MSTPRFSQLLQRNFPFHPTQGQLQAFASLEKWLEIPAAHLPVMMIRGYAGTGKTTTVSALVKALQQVGLRAALLAPTGRAAKVMGGYAQREAFTIHKIIYKSDGLEGAMSFHRGKNFYKNTVFLVDEASMLGSKADFGTNGLLKDLIEFVFEGENNRLVLIGDTAQLPPVGENQSPALEKSFMESRFRVKVLDVELREVMRQEEGSGILWNATRLREQLQIKDPSIRFQIKGFRDVFRMTGERMEDGIRYGFDKFGQENTVVICRSNKAAVQYNQYIRRVIRYCEDEIEAGDVLMIVRNNYFYSEESGKGGFLANGDFVEVRKIITFEELYGFRFAKLRLVLIDYPQEEPFDAWVFLDTLHSHHPALTEEENRRLYQEVREEIMALASDISKTKMKEEVKKHPFLNALQVKFAYALTCHKSQGGQWDAVFVDQGYLKEEQVDKEYVRWLYTALTRARKELFLVNFHANFFA